LVPQGMAFNSSVIRHGQETQEVLGAVLKTDGAARHGLRVRLLSARSGMSTKAALGTASKADGAFTGVEIDTSAFRHLESIAGKVVWLVC